MSKLNGKRILIFQQRGWAINIGHYLAKRLQDEGCRLAALTLKRLTHAKMIDQKEVKYDYLISVDDIFENPDKFLKNENISLKEIYKELNISTIWPLLYSNRLFTKNYKEKYYYSFKQNVSDEFLLSYVKAYYKSIRDLFNNFKPDLVFTAASVYEGHAILNLFANKHNIPFVTITGSIKVKGYYIFSNDYQHRKADFFNRLKELNNNQAESTNRKQAEEYIKESRKQIKQPESFNDLVSEELKNKSIIKKIRHELSPYKQIYLWYTKKKPSYNYIKSVGPSTDYKPPYIILRDHYLPKLFKRFAKNYNYYPYEKINKFIYFPLQFQPEATLDLRAPYFCNQIEVVRQVAMSLPDDYTLVVKEHPGMVGKRRPSYIKKIDMIPNVKLIDYRMSSEEVLKKMDMIVSPNSTSIAEAAYYNKPAIQLGELGTTLALPNVFKHTDMTTLSEKIREILKVDLNNREYEKKLEDYVCAALDTGFNINYHKVWEKGDKKPLALLINTFVREIRKKI